MDERCVNIGLIGFGTVGAGVAQIIIDQHKVRVQVG